MCPYFVFMTGAARYRVQARDRAEAIQMALEEFRPDANTKAVILATMYDEESAKKYISSAPPDKRSEDKGPGDSE